MIIKSIQTEREYKKALADVYELMQTDIKESSEAFDRLENLSLLIKEYEVLYYPLELTGLCGAVPLPGNCDYKKALSKALNDRYGLTGKNKR